jgi:subtilisin family serine protease
MPGSRKVWSLSLLLLAAVCPGLAAQDGSLIALRSGIIDTRQPQPEIPEALSARPDAAPDEIVLVKFPAPPTEQQIAALGAASLRIYAYLPYYTLLVRMPAGGALPAKLGASWSGPYHPLYKISPEIAAVAAGPKSQGIYRPVMLQVYPDADLEEVVGQIRELGVQGIVGFRRNPFFSRVRLLLSPAEIAAFRVPLAGLRDVFWIDLEGRRTLLNDTTVWVGQSGLAGREATPLFSRGLYGQGQTVAVLDTGVDPDACYFRDPVRGLPAVNACDGGTAIDAGQRKVLAVDFLWSNDCAGGVGAAEWDSHGHGTHVAGTVAGDDLAHLLVHDGGDGMAPGARLIIQDGGYQTDSCGDLPGIGCPVVDLNPIFLQAYSQGARLHTNSWGDNEDATVQNNYSAASQDVDEFMWDHKDFLIFFAAGNSGPGAGSVSSPSTAKSAVSVGATQRAESAGSMAGFSSCGPTADGRIKPEITMPGVGILSARNDFNAETDNCGVISSSGTSMASPGAAGMTALIRQYYTEGWYPAGKRSRARRFVPSAALLRATLVSSAVNMAGAQAIPANCQGWGRVQLDRALYFAGQARKLWVKDDAPPFATGSAGQERTYSFKIAGGEPLKVTLAWTDFPSTPAASVNLNNDLDLIVTGPAGTAWRGNVFAAGASAAGGDADRRNTLEQVLLATPAAGTYKVTVRSFNVPNGPQPFALVVTGKNLRAR